MAINNANLILVVNFFHFLAAGVVAPVISYHISLNGGNHVILGTLVAILFLCNKISKDIVGLFEHGKKYALSFSLYCAFVAFFVKVFYRAWYIICLMRIVYALTNQVGNYSKQFIAKTEPESTHVRIFNLLDIIRVTALVTGAVSGGYIFEYTRDFSLLALISSCLTLACILILQYVDADTHLHRPKSNLPSLPSFCYHQLKKLKKVDYRDHWDSILIKCTYSSAFIIYFSRFAYLIWFNYRIGSIVIGYSVAYKHMLRYTSNCLVPFLIEKNIDKTKLFEYNLLICGLSLVGLYWAPTYECYLIIFVPMIFCYVVVNSLLEEDILGFNEKAGLFEAVETITIILNVVAPISFCTVCQFFGGHSFKVLSMLPTATCIYLLNRRFLRPKKEEEKGEVQSEQTREKEAESEGRLKED